MSEYNASLEPPRSQNRSQNTPIRSTARKNRKSAEKRQKKATTIQGGPILRHKIAEPKKIDPPRGLKIKVGGNKVLVSTTAAHVQELTMGHRKTTELHPSHTPEGGKQRVCNEQCAQRSGKMFLICRLRKPGPKRNVGMRKPMIYN